MSNILETKAPWGSNKLTVNVTTGDLAQVVADFARMLCHQDQRTLPDSVMGDVKIMGEEGQHFAQVVFKVYPPPPAPPGQAEIPKGFTGTLYPFGLTEDEAILVRALRRGQFP